MDCLPVIPSTVERVTAMLDYMGLAPGQILGEAPIRRRALTDELAADSLTRGMSIQYALSGPRVLWQVVQVFHLQNMSCCQSWDSRCGS